MMDVSDLKNSQSVDYSLQQRLSDVMITSKDTRSNMVQVIEQICHLRERIRKYVEDNYINFIPNHSNCDMYMDECDNLLREAETLLADMNGEEYSSLAEESNTELKKCAQELCEVSLGLKVCQRILKVDNLFQCIEQEKANKDYLLVLTLLERLNSLVCGEQATDVDKIFQKTECYDTIKLNYYVQINMLHQNLEQRFKSVVQLIENDFPNAKKITIRVCYDLSQTQDIALAFFQAGINPLEMCDFILNKCLLPMIVKPVCVENPITKDDTIELNISYSLKKAKKSLRPSYKEVFANILQVFECLASINVFVFEDQHVFTIIGNNIKEILLKCIIDECLMDAIPETIDEYDNSTLLDDVLSFEQKLADIFLIDPAIDKELRDFMQKLPTYFYNRFNKKVLESAREIMQKDLQDMVMVAENNTPREVANNPFLMAQCMVSKSIFELAKIMDRIVDNGDSTGQYLTLLSGIVQVYITDVPIIHGKLLESIPQQSALFYNNCMYLCNWLAKNVEVSTPPYSALMKSLQTAGNNILNKQVTNQQKILQKISKDLDFSNAKTIGLLPLKLMRQSIRQLEFLRNVWLNVLPDNVYINTFSSLLNDIARDIIKRIMSLEDISAVVANELSELIEILIEKAPPLFKEKERITDYVETWKRLQYLKVILNASLQEIIDLWTNETSHLASNYSSDEVRHMIRALFQNTDRRSKALAAIV